MANWYFVLKGWLGLIIWGLFYASYLPLALDWTKKNVLNAAKNKGVSIPCTVSDLDREYVVFTSDQCVRVSSKKSDDLNFNMFAQSKQQTEEFRIDAIEF